MLPTAGAIKEREPFVDIFEEDDHIRIMAELPGLEENEINLDIGDNTLTISADTSARKCYKKVELPNPINRDAVEPRYRNGILEVKLRKAKNTRKMTT